MESNTIRRNLYKVLRKTGVPRDMINETADLKHEVLQDEIDFTCFLYLLETNFQLNLNNKDLTKLNSVGSTIDLLQKRCA